MARPRSRLNLGALLRSLADVVAPGPDASVAIHFEQRSATQPESGSRTPDLFVIRRFDGRMITRDGTVTEADLRSAGMAAHSQLWLSVVRADDGYRYTVDGVHFGPLTGRVDLFDRERVVRRLDAVAVDDVTIDTKTVGDESVVVLDIDVPPSAFDALRDLFAGDGDEAGDLDLRSYSVSLSAGREVMLDYWWSLAGSEPVDGLAYRHSVACHVQLTLGPAIATAPAMLPRLDPALPVLQHIDDVWELARTTRAAREAAAG